MEEFSKKQLFDHLKSLNLKAGDDVLLHCGMFAFGPFSGGENAFYNALVQYFGTNSTIAVPTFTLWLEPDEIYTINTPSQRMGQFAEYIRTREGAVRSRCPMHNHAAIGPKARYLDDYSGNYSTGPGSDFEFFYEQSFKNVFLGCTPKDSGTYLIHLEAMAGVPYREWLNLTRAVQWKDESQHDFSVRYFGRRKNLPGKRCDTIGIKVDLQILQNLLIQTSVLTEVALPFGRSYAGNITEIHKTIIDALNHNPWLAVSEEND